MLNKIKLLSCLFLFSLLSGCFNPQSSPYSYSDGYTYRVHGKSYPVMRSAKNYKEKGLASWYGRKFHRKRTSSGERYNMYELTAAHKTLPLSSRVLVTNLNNGRHVVVKVNDRGPFVSNRIIDLSYAAAKKLGMVGRGLANVEVKSLERTA